MFARINYVDIKPDSFDEVDPFWRETVSSYDNLVKGFFLRDGDTAHTLSMVVFESETAMKENTERQLGPIVQRAAEHRLSEPELHPMEVCAHVPASEQGAVGYARVVDVTLKVDRMAEVIAAWPGEVSAYDKAPGFRGAWMCTDRTSGKTKSISLWASRADADANESSGAFQAAVEPYREMIEVAPVRSYWNVRVEV